MASCCRKTRFSRAKLHRPLSVALKKQHSKNSNSPVKLECRARLQKVNDINGYEVLAKDRFSISVITTSDIGDQLPQLNIFYRRFQLSHQQL
jgi:hypothetical protein